MLVGWLGNSPCFFVFFRQDTSVSEKVPHSCELVYKLANFWFGLPGRLLKSAREDWHMLLALILRSIPSKWTRRVWVANCCWPLWWPLQSPWKADHGYWDSISRNANPASSFELSQCRHCKERLPGPKRAFRVPSGSLSPKTGASIYTL